MSDLLMAHFDQALGRTRSAFLAWHDAHAEARLDIAKFRDARRYTSVDDSPRRFMALYELTVADVLSEADYRRLKTNRPPGEAEVIRSLPEPIERRIYTEIGSAATTDDFSVIDVDAVTAIWIAVKSGSYEDFTTWLLDAHLASVRTSNAWRRTRRFCLVDGSGPRLMLLHEFNRRISGEWPRDLLSDIAGLSRLVEHAERRDYVIDKRFVKSSSRSERSECRPQ